MKKPTLIIDTARRDIAKAYRAKPNKVLINGGLVFYSEVLRALARYSAADQIVFLNVDGCSPSDSSELSDDISTNGKVSFINCKSLPTLSGISQPVFFTPTEQAAVLSGIRHSFGMSNAPLFSFLHAADPNWFLPHYLSYLMRGACASDGIICSSVAGRRVVEGMNRHLCRVGVQAPFPELPLIPLGYFVEDVVAVPQELARRKLQIPNEACCIVYFGRLEMQGKADLCPLLLLLHSMRHLHNLVIICAGGDKPREIGSKLQEFARTATPGLDVRVHANPTDVVKHELLSAADIYVSPGEGIKETFGISLLEAMSFSLPLVITDWSGYRDIVVDGYNGFLIPTFWHQTAQGAERLAAIEQSHDEVQSATTSFDFACMFKALLTLIVSESTRRTFGLRSRQIAEQRYSWSVVIKQYDLLFDQQLRVASDGSQQHNYPYIQDLFSHYPTRVVPTNAAYIRGPLYSTPIKDALRKSVYHPLWVDEDIFCKIEDHLERASTVTVADLLQDGVDETMASSHLGRLCKYGVIDVIVEGISSDFSSH